MNDYLAKFREALNLTTSRLMILDAALYSINAWGKHPIRILINGEWHEMSSSYIAENNPYVGAQINVSLKIGDTVEWDPADQVFLTKVGEHDASA